MNRPPRISGLGLRTLAGALLALASARAPAGDLPTVDLSGDAARQVVIAAGTADVYQGHPTTLLMPDGRTMYCVWTIGHGGSCGPMKRSDDGGRTWSGLLPVPENWAQARNCPAIYRLADPRGAARLFVFAGNGPDGAMQQSHSDDGGRTWTPMAGNGLVCVMPFCTIVPVDGGARLLGMSNIRRPGETKEKRSNVIARSWSSDGGFAWSPWDIVLDLGDIKPCEPELVRSPDGRELLCLLRENARRVGGFFMTSADEGRTWSPPRPLPPGLHGDRHKARYAPDGRLVVCFRDVGRTSPARDHFVAWVGRYEDIPAGRDGQYRVKLLHSHAGSDCGYPGLELLPGGVFAAATYIRYRPGPERHSVVSARFTLAETDALAAAAAAGKTNAPPAGPAGILMDDGAGDYTGEWVESGRQPALVGGGYRHDNRQGAGTKKARFAPDLPQAGAYEVRLLYTATSNRATNVPVTVACADGARTVPVNEREPVLEDGVPRALGVFRFEAGRAGWVEVSNAGVDGFVVVDGVQFVPAAIAREERAGRRAAGFPVRAPELRADAGAQAAAAAVAVSPLAPAGTAPEPPRPGPAEPVRLARDAPPRDVDGRSFDAVVVGGTPAGVACAVRAAREGCSVLLVNHTRHIGGMMANGLMQWDALYGGHRAPLFTEVLRNLERHYIATCGRNSPDHQVMRFTHEHYPVGWAEPHVAEREFNRLVAGERNITLLLGHDPAAVERDGALLRGASLRAYPGTEEIRVRASAWVDATYEGDLFALAKVPYRVGREARDEYGEPHAGQVFGNIAQGPAPRDAVEGRLNLHPYSASQGTIDPGSPFSADGAVQAYNYRFCVSCDPTNRILPERPSGYRREEYVAYERKGIATNPGPNRKSHMNSPILPGENHGYPEAGWPERERIIGRHRDFALGLMWFLQNDASVPAAQRAKFREWGLAKDEFPDHDHIPYEMYVREARRIVGRDVYTEHDNSLAPGTGRTPVHDDSVAITDWYMDSHACTTNRRPGYRYDGKLILTEESRPGQIPYRCLLPRGADNLLVPVCLSASHVAWGAVRLEPVGMQVGEAAGYAAALAKRQGVAPAALDPDLLLRTLCEARFLVSFFNDVNVAGPEPWIPAAQYFGARGFFADYDARMAAPLKAATGRAWAAGLAELMAGTLDADALARKVAAAESGGGPAMTDAAFATLLPAAAGAPAPGATPIARGAAVERMWKALSERRAADGVARTTGGAS